jgi:hypothetical protein
MEKESKNAAHKIVVVLEGMRYRKAVAKPEMAMANANPETLLACYPSSNL